jgi:alkylation response protein AidB-like acyl-CoA dehydrogenase
MAMITLDEALAMQESMRRLLADRSTEKDVRGVMETAEGYEPALWRQLAAIGVTGLVVDPQYGGTGAGPRELELVMEEAGAALLCAPLLSSGVLAATLVAACDAPHAAARLLPGIAAGTTLATVAMTGDAGTWTPDGVAVTARPADPAWTIDGVASFVMHGATADLLLVVARVPDGFGIFEVAPGAAGTTVAALPTFDRTLRLARAEFAATPAVRLGTAGWHAVQRALDLALVAKAGEQAGGARRIFESTVAYTKTRFQFGRAIGSFQAIKHMAADLLLDVESATSAARHAAQQLADGSADAAAAIRLAAFTCADAYVKVAATAIQMHGGIAFTWDHPAHLYLRRARADAQLLGTPSMHREAFLAAMGA